MRTLASMAFAIAAFTFACAVQSHGGQFSVTEDTSQATATGVELTLALVDPAGRDVTAEAILDQPPKKLYLYREGDTMGSDSREAKFGVPIHISTQGEPRRIVQLPPDAADEWLKHGWGIAGDPAPALVLEPDAVGDLRLALQVAPLRRIRLARTLPDDLTKSVVPFAYGYFAPAQGQCRNFDFQNPANTAPETLVEREFSFPAGEYEVWAVARAGTWPLVELWAHRTIQVLDRHEPQEFVLKYERGVEIEGRIVDMRPVSTTGIHVGPRSSSSFGLSPSGIANRSFGPTFHQTRQHCDLWSFTPNTGGDFKVTGLPPETELWISQRSAGFIVPAHGGNVGEVVVRND